MHPDERDIAAEVAENIRRLRQAKGLKQRDLASLMQIPVSAVCDTERAKRSVSVPEAFKWAAALDVSLAEIIPPSDAAEPEEWECWIVYFHDMNTIVDAAFPRELDALRHAVQSGCGHSVQRVKPGEIRDQLK